MFIKQSFDTEQSTEDIYIYLENILTNVFHDIYKEQIENRLISKQQYIDVIKSMMKTNCINYIFFIDNNENSSYYVQIDDDASLSIFAEEIANVAF